MTVQLLNNRDGAQTSGRGWLGASARTCSVGVGGCLDNKQLDSRCGLLAAPLLCASYEGALG